MTDTTTYPTYPTPPTTPPTLPTTPSAPAPKTLGDYGVEVEKSMANNNTSGVPPIAAEMRAAAPPLPPPPKEGEPVPEPVKPPPVDLGLRGFADALDAAAQANNVVTARQLAEDMIILEPPTPPPAAPPVADPPVGSTYAPPVPPAA